MNCLKCLGSQRVITSVMGSLAALIGYATRICISVAITEMVVPLNNTKNGNESLVCAADQSVDDSNHLHTDTNGTRYDWSQQQQGWILSSFYIGYVFSHIPSGQISQKYGGKWTLSLAVLLGGICSIATPLSIDLGGISTLLLLRILMGLTSGTLFPALTVLLAAWIPARERSTLGTLALGGSQLGSVLSFFLSGLLLSHWPWPIVFYFWGAVSIGWFVLFTFICYNDPETHPYISEQEREYLRAEIGQLKRDTALPPTPWRSILISAPVVAYICAQMGQDWIIFVMSSNLPKYMREVIGFSVRDVGLYSSLPYVLMWIISLVSARICDYLIGHDYVSITKARKIFTVAGGIPPAIFIIAASYALCDRVAVVCCFILGLGMTGNYFSGFRLNALDLSPNYSGSLMGLTNGLGSIAGIVAPVFVGMMTPNSSLEEYRFVFWITFGLTVIRCVIYLIWGSGEVQPWNKPSNL